MKIIITGSLGHISKPLTEELVQKGHAVTVISSNPEKLIEKAKERLYTTGLSVSEIAYELGFEHPQSFSKLFKTKTNLSPLEFRQSFN